MRSRSLKQRRPFFAECEERALSGKRSGQLLTLYEQVFCALLTHVLFYFSNTPCYLNTILVRISYFLSRIWVSDESYRNSRWLEAIHHSTLVDKIRIPFCLHAQLFFPFPFLVLTSPPVTKGSGIGTTRIPYFGQTLLHLNSAADVLEIGWIFWLIDVICSHDCARSYQPKMLAKLEIRRIGRLVMIKGHQVDVF